MHQLPLKQLEIYHAFANKPPNYIIYYTIIVSLYLPWAWAWGHIARFLSSESYTNRKLKLCCNLQNFRQVEMPFCKLVYTDGMWVATTLSIFLSIERSTAVMSVRRWEKQVYYSSRACIILAHGAAWGSKGPKPTSIFSNTTRRACQAKANQLVNKLRSPPSQLNDCWR